MIIPLNTCGIHWYGIQKKGGLEIKASPLVMVTTWELSTAKDFCKETIRRPTWAPSGDLRPASARLQKEKSTGPDEAAGSGRRDLCVAECKYHC